MELLPEVREASLQAWGSSAKSSGTLRRPQVAALELPTSWARKSYVLGAARPAWIPDSC